MASPKKAAAKPAKKRTKAKTPKTKTPTKTAPKATKPTKKPTKKAAPKAAASAASFRMPAIDPAAQRAMEEVLGTHPELRPGKMFGCPGYFLGAKAVACVFGGDVNVTLPPAEIDELVKKPGFRRFEARGRTMSGWVLLDRKQVSFRNQPLFERAIEYARAKADAAGKRR